jgi:ABC-2 type transport system ATP-binding protein
VIRRGRLLAVGRPDDLRRSNLPPRLEILTHGFDPTLLEDLSRLPGVVEARREEGRLTVGLRDDEPAAPLVRYLVERGVEVEEVRRASASLEDVFLTLMEEEP